MLDQNAIAEQPPNCNAIVKEEGGREFISV
jgi:hypothetical protein